MCVVFVLFCFFFLFVFCFFFFFFFFFFFLGWGRGYIPTIGWYGRCRNYGLLSWERSAIKANVPSFEPGEFQNIALHAWRTARNSALPAFALPFHPATYNKRGLQLSVSAHAEL